MVMILALGLVEALPLHHNWSLPRLVAGLLSATTGRGMVRRCHVWKMLALIFQ